MLDFQEDLYEVLGVEEASTPEEIRKAYLKLAKRLHPDRFPNDSEKRAEAQAEFSKVTRAHDILSDSKQRDEYNALRGLARNKAALDAGEPAPTSLGVAPAEQKENKESWALKHCQRATEMLSRKKFPDAETAIKEALRLCPNNPIYHAMLAEIQLARGWKTLAMTSVQSALKIDPKCHEAKSVELKLKTQAKSAAGKDMKSSGGHKNPTVQESAAGGKKGFLDQLKELLNKKM